MLSITESTPRNKQRWIEAKTIRELVPIVAGFHAQMLHACCSMSKENAQEEADKLTEHYTNPNVPRQQVLEFLGREEEIFRNFSDQINPGINDWPLALAMRRFHLISECFQRLPDEVTGSFVVTFVDCILALRHSGVDTLDIAQEGVIWNENGHL